MFSLFYIITYPSALPPSAGSENCISNEDGVETVQIHLLYIEQIHSYSCLLSFPSISMFPSSPSMFETCISDGMRIQTVKTRLSYCTNNHSHPYLLYATTRPHARPTPAVSRRGQRRIANSEWTKETATGRAWSGRCNTGTRTSPAVLHRLGHAGRSSTSRGYTFRSPGSSCPSNRSRRRSRGRS